MKKLWISILAFFCLVALAILVLQSGWSKRIAQKFLEEALSQSGYTAEIGSVQGTIPHAVDLKNVTVSSDSITISIDSLSTRISLLALAKKEILFTDLKARGVSWTGKPHAPVQFGKGKGISFAVRVKQFDLKDVHLPDGITADFTGALRIGRHNTDAYLDLAAVRQDYPDSKAHLTAYLDETGAIRLKGEFMSPTFQAIPVKMPIEGSSNLRFAIRGRDGKFKGRLFGTVAPKVGSPTIAPYVEKDWTVNARIGNESGSWEISQFDARANGWRIQGNGQTVLVKSTEPEFSAKLEFASTEEGLSVKASGSMPKFTFKKISLENVQIKTDFIWNNQTASGDLLAAALLNKTLWKGKSAFSWSEGGSFFLDNASVKAPSSNIQGSLEIRPDRIAVGEMQVDFQNLQDLPFGVYGSAQGKVDWFPMSGKQVMTADLNGANLYWKEIFLANASIETSLLDPFDSIEGRFIVLGSDGKWRNLTLDQTRFETLFGGPNWPFALSLNGRWKHPLELNLDGAWNGQNDGVLFRLDNASGSFYNHPISLLKSTEIALASDRFRVSGLDLKLADARAFLLIDEFQQEMLLQAALERFPLDILSLNPLDIPIGGKTNLNLYLSEKNQNVTGTLKASIENMEVDTAAPITASGTVEGTFKENRLDLKGTLLAKESPLMNLDLSIPLSVHLRPLSASLIYDDAAKGSLALNGRIEELLDFFDLGNHRIEGDLSAALKLGNTLRAPDISGDFRFQNGSYQNYLTGTRLANIQAEGKARGNKLLLESFTAGDDFDGQGGLTAYGEIDFLPSERFPFLLNITLKHFHIAQIDLVTAEADGTLQITGNLNGADARGTLSIVQSNLHVPERIPRSLPNLIVIYKNAQKPIPEPQAPTHAPYPIRLDLEIQAPDGIIIDGRGLDSEWKGTFHIGGTFNSVQTQGKLELIKGEFLFSGRHFKLMDSSLSFTGKEKEMPYLNLGAQIDIKDISITARLKGPLNNPQLTLQSVPPLPLSKIMSYLLFGQEIAEINSFQALQLANSLASLAGQGPDVLESTRKALGVDRLNIVSVPSGDTEIEDTIALQVGKYVSEGVLVSLTQGAEESSTNINIEIELSAGWTVQLESDQRQEQGKFAIKWNHNY